MRCLNNKSTNIYVVLLKMMVIVLGMSETLIPRRCWAAYSASILGLDNSFDADSTQEGGNNNANTEENDGDQYCT